jgi:hypothetical protein
MKVRPIISSSLLVTVLCFIAFAQGGRFAVQLGASPDRAEAEAKLKDAQRQKLDAYLVKSEVPGKGIFYRVRLGNYSSRAAAEKAAQQFKASGAISEYFVAAYETPEAAPAMVAKAAPTPASTPARVAANPAPVTVAPKATSPAAVSNTGMPAIGSASGNPANAKPATPASTASNRSVTTAPVAPTTGTGSAPAAMTKPAGTTSVLGGYTRFTDEGVGYSFEHPAYWVGGPLNSNEVQAARNSGGAMFKSNEDQAFLNAIWNKLDKANSTEHDNDMIVDLILKSMATGNGTQNMTATNRTVINEGPLIKTFLDLKAAFVVPNQTSPLDFIGKGVIIRASKGILLVVTFYSKDAPQTVAMAADHIIKTTRTPE